VHTEEFFVSLCKALFLGVYVLILANKFKIPAIVPLLLTGIALGPMGLGWMEIPGTELKILVMFAVAIILFEGGLSLEPSGYKMAKGTIFRLLSLGTLTTWVGATLVVWGVLDLSFELSMLAGSLVIVTGPTVISPLLRRIPIKRNLHHILYYEGVLGDPIGVFVAVLCLEWVMMSSSIESAAIPLLFFFQRIFFGIILGVLGGFWLEYILKRIRIPEDILNIFVLGNIMGLYGLCELIASETGLLAMTVCGFVLGARQAPFLKKIKMFQLELTDLSIAALFIMLASRVDLTVFLDLGWKALAVILGVLWLIRPLTIIVSTAKEKFSWREKLILMWISPKGIVAAAMASLVGFELQESNAYASEIIPAYVFSIIAFSVLVQGMTAGIVSKILKVQRPKSRDWVIAGANTFAQELAKFIESQGVKVFLVDNNANLIEQARNKGLRATLGDAMDPHLQEWEEFLEVGYFLALTDNREFNMNLCVHWKYYNESIRTYRWGSVDVNSKHRIDDRTYGKRIFHDIEKPSLISRWIDIWILSPEVSPLHNGNESLLEFACFRNGRVFLNRNTDKPRDPLPGQMRFFLRRPTEPISRALPERNVIFREKLESLDEAFKKILPQFLIESPEVLSKNILEEYEELVAEEDGVVAEFKTTIVHIRSEHFKGNQLGMVLSRTPFDFKGKSTQVAFFLLSHKDNSSDNLKILAALARLAVNPMFGHEIRKVHNWEELIGIIRKYS
jgi:NhaP-type Na+/H+ or K+/H+ antiporter/mannitol/fructose-specific phosphotransferase system IIA component (Ntr-type)